MDQEAIWAMYYAGIVSIKHHPKNEHIKVNLTTCAAIADEMMKEHLKRFGTPEDQKKWHG